MTLGDAIDSLLRRPNPTTFSHVYTSGFRFSSRSQAPQPFWVRANPRWCHWDRDCAHRVWAPSAFAECPPEEEHISTILFGVALGNPAVRLHCICHCQLGGLALLLSSDGGNLENVSAPFTHVT